MFTVTFVKDAAERAVKTFAQALLATITVGEAITSIDWGQGAAIAATASAVSVLTSIVSSSVGDKESASLAGK